MPIENNKPSELGTLKKLYARLQQNSLDLTGVHLFTVDMDSGEKSVPIDLIVNEKGDEAYIRIRKIGERAEPSVLSGNED